MIQTTQIHMLSCKIIYSDRNDSECELLNVFEKYPLLQTVKII